MINLSTLSIKNINRIIEKFSIFLTEKLSFLNKKNFLNLISLLISDKRFIITLSIICLTIFAHLSTPSFYKSDWVEQKVKKQLEEDFDVILNFSEPFNYSMFPVPNFTFKNIKLNSKADDKEFASIKELKIFLSFKKFFDKNKINIQYIKIKDSQFSIYDNQIKDLINFFDEKINDKKLIILKSKIFLKDKEDDIYCIINIEKSESYSDLNLNHNKLNLSGDIFNNKFKLSLINNFLIKSLDIDLNLPYLNKSIKNKLIYGSKEKIGKLNISGIGNNYNLNYIFKDNELKLVTDQDSVKRFNFSSLTKFKPFFSDINFEFKKLDLKELVNSNNYFFSFLTSEIFFNENLNYRINIKSKDLSNHRKLKNLDMMINYDQQNINFNNSSLTFGEILDVNIIDSKLAKDTRGEKIYFNFLIDIKDNKKLYSFFQTRKEYRKEIKKISIQLEYYITGNYFIINDIYLDKNTSDELKTLIQNFNSDKKILSNRIEFKNFFNNVIELF